MVIRAFKEPHQAHDIASTDPRILIHQDFHQGPGLAFPLHDAVYLAFPGQVRCFLDTFYRIFQIDDIYFQFRTADFFQDFSDFCLFSNQDWPDQPVPCSLTHRLEGMFILGHSHSHPPFPRLLPEHLFHLFKIFQHHWHFLFKASGDQSLRQ